MSRAALFALVASSVLVASSAFAGAAQAQQICCAPSAPPPAGLRGYAQPDYSAYPQQQYAPPQYGERPSPSGLRGRIGVEYGKTRANPDTPSPRTETWTAEGAVSTQMGGFGVQGDLKVADRSGPDGTSWSPTAHIFKRNPYGLIGGWVGYSGADGADLFGLGLEGQAYMHSATLYGSVGYGHVDDVTNRSLWAARLEGRYFVTENLMLNLQGGLVRTSEAGAHTTVRTVGFGAEYQPGALPFSVQAGYSHADASNSSAESDTIRIGLRWNLTGGTLAERDRLGTTLNNVTDLFLLN
jgi:hypothetical protein